MVIKIEEYLSRRLSSRTHTTVDLDAAPERSRAHEWPVRLDYGGASAPVFLGSAALALSPDAIALPTAFELNAVYAEATLI